MMDVADTERCLRSRQNQATTSHERAGRQVDGVWRGGRCGLCPPFCRDVALKVFLCVVSCSLLIAGLNKSIGKGKLRLKDCTPLCRCGVDVAVGREGGGAQRCQSMPDSRPIPMVLISPIHCIKCAQFTV